VSASLLELGTRPIEPDAPSGRYGRDEPEFVALQAEIRKLELPDQPTPDWDLVLRGCSALLAGTSKDLLVVVYLGQALLETQGLAGLATGLTVLRDVLANFWDTLYPEAKRMRGRVAAIEWLAERASKRLARPLVVSPDPASIAQCLERVDEIGAFLAERVESGRTLLVDLRRALEEAQAGAAEPEAAGPAAAAASAPATASAPEAAAGPSTIASTEDFDRALAEARRLLSLAGDYLRATAPRDPLAYRLPRLAAWLGVRQLPPHVDGKSQVPPIQPPTLAEKLEQMLAAGQWPGVLQETEDRLATAVLWLDLQRYAVTALERLGPDYATAADAVCEELAALLRRVPGLAELRFANDVPLANAETRAWIAERVLKQDGAAGPPAVRSAAAAEPATDEAFEKTRAEAWALARQKQLAEAIALLEQGAQRACRLGERVRWKLETARLCLDQGRGATALAQLEALDDELRRSTIEQWNPALCVEVIRELIQCRQRVLATAHASPEESERTRALMSRLARLDLVAALALNK
jgi:type VI secretion system protein VasJ